MIREFAGIDHPATRVLAVAYRGLRHVDRLRRAMRPRVRPPVPTVSVGNITVGGTGKTPLVGYLCELVAAWGLRPAVLARGYLGSERGPIRVAADGHPLRFGDEAVMLARRGLDVWIAKEREAGVEPACREADVLILDDGFQRVEIERDLDLVTFGHRGLGNGRMLPAGILRDAIPTLERADAFVGRRPHLPALFPETPRFDFGHGGLVLLPQAPPPGTPTAALAAIGQPSQFFAALEDAGVALALRHPLADHDPLLPPTLAELERHWREAGIRAVVVTEKDAVKLPPTIGEVAVVVARSQYGPAGDDEARAFERFLRGRLGL